jgi:hypothetical protein
MANTILELFNKNPSKLMTYKEVSREIRVGNKLDRERVQAILEDLAHDKKTGRIGQRSISIKHTRRSYRGYC